MLVSFIVITIQLGDQATDITGSAKCVIVVNHSLAIGLAANAAAVVAASLGRGVTGLIGPDVADASGNTLPGIVSLPLPILAASAHTLATVYAAARESGVGAVGFTSLAQSCHDYDDYTSRLASTPSESLTFAAIALVGDASLVTKLTASLPLLR